MPGGSPAGGNFSDQNWVISVIAVSRERHRPNARPSDCRRVSGDDGRIQENRPPHNLTNTTLDMIEA